MATSQHMMYGPFMAPEKSPRFNPRIFERHARGLRVVDRSQETGPAFLPVEKSKSKRPPAK